MSEIQSEEPHNYSAATLLTAGDPRPVTVYNAPALADNSVLIICDHASNKIPKKLNTLGVDHATLEKHIAYDIGTEYIGKYIADQMNVPAVLSGFSRLVVDLNRDLDHHCSIAEINDDIRIPGNENLHPAQKQRRIDEIYTPYHAEISASIDTIRKQGKQPFVISVHSFTPEMNGVQRETEIGILWEQSNKDIATAILKDLENRNPDLVVGNNQPYSFVDEPRLNHTIHHNLKGSTPYLLVEFRQDLVNTKTGAEKYTNIFLESLRQVITDFNL
ncbi:MAG: N-formylglutamate amidohydrolase [Pseudomonadota bacterium]